MYWIAKYDTINKAKYEDFFFFIYITAISNKMPKINSPVLFFPTKQHKKNGIQRKSLYDIRSSK